MIQNIATGPDRDQQKYDYQDKSIILFDIDIFVVIKHSSYKFAFLGIELCFEHSSYTHGFHTFDI